MIALLVGLLAAILIVLAVRGSDPDAATRSDVGAPTTVADTAVGSQEPTAPDGEATQMPQTDPSPPPTPSPTPSPTPPTTQVPTPAPAFTSVDAPATYFCSDSPGQETSRQLTLQWSAAGAEFVRVSIDSPNGVFASGLPPTGSLIVPAPCAPDSNTYYVTAVASDGRTATSSTTTEGR